MAVTGWRTAGMTWADTEPTAPMDGSADSPRSTGGLVSMRTCSKCQGPTGSHWVKASEGGAGGMREVQLGTVRLVVQVKA